MRRIPIRLKLASALALPLIALAIVSVLELAESSRQVGEINRQTNLARASIGPSGLLRVLQNERTWPAVELVGFTSVTVPVEGYEETRADTDQAIEAFRAQVDAADPEVRTAFADALEGLDELEQIRADIDASTTPHNPMNIAFAGEVFDRYTEVIQPFFSAASRVSLSVDGDADLRQGTELANLSTRVIEVQSVMLSDTLTGSYLSPGGIDESTEISGIAMLQSEFQQITAKLQSPTGRYAEIARRSFPTDLAQATNEQVSTAIANGRVDLASAMEAVTVEPDAGFLGYEDAIIQAVNDRADHLDTAARTRRLWYGGLGIAALVSTITLTLLVSRSITRPLRSLTHQAKDMAERGLPEAVLDVLETPLGEDVSVPDIAPIKVKTRDEVADVADALNTVQDSALDLAVEQAVLRRNIADSFTNLGRRNQNLLSRQLDFITQLEANETDPDTLAALFRLDHLATRMRRNAESLLVLAGIGPPRRWAAPVPVVDVIRAAFGEVETYERAVVRDVEPVLVMGSAAADLAHLLAELLENALTFSPPEEKVEVRGRRLDDGYTIAVIDAGFGMAEAELAQANRRLAGTESFTVAPSKYLGHYVAGNLAARHGIEIRLTPAPGQGITALVTLPPALLAPEGSAGAGGSALGVGGGAGAGGSSAGTGVPATAALWSGSPQRVSRSALTEIPANPPARLPEATGELPVAMGTPLSPSAPAGGAEVPPGSWAESFPAGTGVADAPGPWSGATPSPAGTAATTAPGSWPAGSPPPSPAGTAATTPPGSWPAGSPPPALPGGSTPTPWSEPVPSGTADADPPAAWSGAPPPDGPGSAAPGSWSGGPGDVPPRSWTGASPGEAGSAAPGSWTGGAQSSGPGAAVSGSPGGVPSGGSGAGASGSWPAGSSDAGGAAAPGSWPAGSWPAGSEGGPPPPGGVGSPGSGPAAWGGDPSPDVDAGPWVGPSGQGSPSGQPGTLGPTGAGGVTQPGPGGGEPGPGAVGANEAYGRHRDYRHPVTPFPAPPSSAAAGRGPGAGGPPATPDWRPAPGTQPATGTQPAPESSQQPPAAGWAPPEQPAPAGPAPESVGLANALDGVPSRPMWAALANLRPARPTTRPVASGADPRSGGTTAAGLTRRVSGAQMPTMQPRTIHRADASEGGASGGEAPAARPGDTGTQQAVRPPGVPYSEADASAEAAAGGVYDFLTRFTAGVQRGLDESSDEPRGS